MKSFVIAAAICVGSFSFGSNIDSAKKVQNFFTKVIESSSTFVDAASSVGSPLFAEQLKNHALHRYLNIYKSYGGEYAPQAFLVPNSASGLGEDLVVIAQDTDGGSYFYVFTVDGQPVAEASQGESGDLQW